MLCYIICIPLGSLQLKVVIILDKRLKPLLQVLDIELLSFPLRQDATHLLGRDEDVGNDVDDTIGRDAILHRDAGEAVDLDVDVAAVAGNVDAERAVLEQSGEIDL